MLTTFQPNIRRKSLTIHIHTAGFGLILSPEHGAQIPRYSYMTDAEGRKTDCRPGHSRKRDEECRDGAEAPSLPGVLRPEHSGEGVDSQPCSPWSELPARASANSRQQSTESLFLWRLSPERTSTARCLSVHPLSSYSQEAKGRQYQPSTKKRAAFLAPGTTAASNFPED